MKICKDGRVWGQTNKEAGNHLGILTGYKYTYIKKGYDHNPKRADHLKSFWWQKGHIPWNKDKKGVQVSSKETKKKQSDSMLKIIREKPEWLSKIPMGQPTDIEKIIIDMNVSNLWYCGNGKFWISVDEKNLNPDFKVHGQKKVVEVFGDYWHKGENPQDRIDLYNQVGFKCLVFWGHELKENLNDHKDRIKDRILNFINKRYLKCQQLRL